MIAFPNCKINLGLSVLRKRDDGFHDVETIMYPVPLTDALEIIPSPDGKFSFTVSGFDISGDRKNNLVIKAYELLKRDFNLGPVHIHLHKAVPMGAGLGGGSADAALTIQLLNEIFELKLSTGQIENYCRQLGSDCAFFVRNKPALAFEKGDRFKPAEVDLNGYHLVIVKPDIHINTAEAYSWITPSPKDNSLHNIIRLPVEEWQEKLINDFEEPLFQRFKEIRQIKHQLLEAGAVYTSLTGSGAAVYGIFQSDPDMKGLFEDCFVWQGIL
ncbi:MAG: 4-(cytidine 5'-diphospho)-2-C-methyl-D-erythritol kinase [Bacteroidales bacterium]|nr:4-(cytidine 5'-diphospho)-2-C-methyl-D-erythritol kinase [Bacteroidales bacterium]